MDGDHHLAASDHPNHLHAFLRRYLRTHEAILRTHAYLLRRHLLLGHPVASGLLLSSAAAFSPAGHLLRLLLLHLRPPLPLFSLNSSLRAAASRHRLPFPILLSLFSSLLSSYHPVFPDHFSFPPLLAAAPHLAAGELLHSQVLRRGLLFSPPPHAANSLLHFYSSASHLAAARKLFDEMPLKDIASYNSMMTAYASSGAIASARELFDQMSLRNVVSWNVMITRYVKAKRPERALEMVREMAGIGVRGSATTMVGAATACARLGRFWNGREVHGVFLRRFMEDNLVFWTSLIDMYGKCRRVDVARRVFDRVGVRNLVCWNAMIVGHCVYGEASDGLELFHEMIGRGEGSDDGGQLPDEITFIGVLCACARLGLLAEGKTYFEQMSTLYNLKPTFAHYWCMANLFRSLGLLQEAEDVLKSVPEETKAQALGGLLGLCRFRGEWELGERIALRLIELEPSNGIHYALLCSVYVAAGRWDDAQKVKAIIKERGDRFSPGHRLVNLNQIVHQFKVRDRPPENQEIYVILDALASRLKLTSGKEDQNDTGLQ